MFWCETPRDVVRLSGPDALGYLQSQVSQDLRHLATGDATWTLVLEPMGKVVALARVHRVADTEVHLDVEAGFGDVLAERLTRFRIRVKADIDLVRPRCVTVLPEAHDTVPLQMPSGVPSWGGGVALFGDAAATPPGRPGADDEVSAARIDAAWPAMGAEIVPGTTLPAETGVVSATVSFTKGCYPGQELVERMDSRGSTAPRAVQRVTVPVGTEVGDEIEVSPTDGTASASTGVVTSVVGTAALALVRRAPRRAEPTD